MEESHITFYKEKIKDLEELNASLKQIVSAKDYELSTVRRDAQTVVAQWREAASEAEKKERNTRQEYDHVFSKLQYTEKQLTEQQRYAVGSSEEVNKLKSQLKAEAAARQEACSEVSSQKLKISVVESDCYKAHERVNALERMLENAGDKLKNYETEIHRLQEEKALLDKEHNGTLTTASKWKSDAVEASALVTTLRGEVAGLREETQGLQEILEGRINQIKDLESQLSDKKQEYDTLESKCADMLQKQDELQFLHAEVTAQLEAEKAKSAQQNEELNCLGDGMRSAETENVTLTQQIATQKTQLEALVQANTTLTTNETNLVQKLKDCETQKDQLADDLQESRDELISSSRVIQELQGQYQFLSQTKNEMEEEKIKLLSLQGQLETQLTKASDEAAILQSTVEEMNSKNGKLALTVTALEQDLMSLGKEKHTLLSQLDQVNSKLELMEEKCNHDIPMLMQELQQWKSRDEKNEVLLKQKHNENEKITQQVHNLEEKYILLTSQITSYTTAIKEKDEMILSLSQSVQAEGDSHSKTKESLNSLKEEVVTLEAKLQESTEKLSQLENDYSNEMLKGKVDQDSYEQLQVQLQNSNAAFAECVNTHSEEMQALRDELSSVERTNAAASEEISRLNRIKDTLEDDIAAVTKEKRRLAASLQMIEKDKAEVSKQCSDLKHQCDHLTRQCDDLERDFKAAAIRKENVEHQAAKDKEHYHEQIHALKEEVSHKDMDRRAFKEKLHQLEQASSHNKAENLKTIKAKTVLLEQKMEELSVESKKRSQLKLMFEELKQRCDQKDEMIDVIQNERDEVVRNHDGVVHKYNHLFEVYKDLKKKSEATGNISSTTLNNSNNALAPLATSAPSDAAAQIQIQKLKHLIEDLKNALSTQLECCRLQQSEFHSKCNELRTAQEQLRVLNNRLTLACKKQGDSASVSTSQSSASTATNTNGRSTILGSGALSVQPLNLAEGHIRRPKKREADNGQLTAPHHSNRAARPPGAVDMNATV